jgi:DnaK suppressor protein
MNIGELEKRLRQKEQELLADIARTESEARESRVAEVENGIDRSVSSEAKESLLYETTSDWNVFTQVRGALERIKKGGYGKCIDCGRQIDAARLESIPWTPYCLADEERHDRERAATAAQAS